jgi:hypothetical protein
MDMGATVTGVRATSSKGAGFLAPITTVVTFEVDIWDGVWRRRLSSATSSRVRGKCLGLLSVDRGGVRVVLTILFLAATTVVRAPICTIITMILGFRSVDFGQNRFAVAFGGRVSLGTVCWRRGRGR